MRLPLSGIPKSRAYSVITYITPRPVASSRPSDPPSETGLPVTAAGGEPCPLRESSRDHPLTRAVGVTSGARVLGEGAGVVGGGWGEPPGRGAGAKLGGFFWGAGGPPPPPP